ncbi:3-hydroxy-3-methylglutaryl CoA synthase [Bernardetia litoralis DSM 6794]|uniref:3-hydroxy-3-methylglutaryl CoA synthase n=1 Tax=Bernardetia litoralis (strain ATCC 23117 / DSM 6794 / NBRC 15988 / NCIMB 1366 / Fx l1 / Sio-4) TaxID=880071 RepID=I4AP73_BERLS|nr:hydroxymethylglutaryl-CoA synthase [Bernardetia litoralis]AFM05758.1 3-hydroxy-3-methylglutaryl CoA synthase [Bernardetia litoralis DSM 6794]
MTSFLMNQSTVQVGIDAMSFYIPSIYLDLQTLAPSRNLDYEKLSKGLGVLKMALPDTNEDAASMAANAVLKLLKDYNLNPSDIGRLYIGTESGLDGAKPIATYVLEMLTQKLQEENNTEAEFFENCDALDMTFACIGGVDALQNTLDWARNNKNRVGIVVSTDYAKYDKFSGGEYTQGAGAVAMLIKQNPRLLAINDIWGISTKSEHDFFKPNFRETPVFDGQFSNSCYQNRLHDAYFSFKKQAIEEGVYDKNSILSEEWNSLIFHLPYAFHGKRMFSQIFTEERILTDNQEIKTLFLEKSNLKEEDINIDSAQLVRLISKTDLYKNFVKEKISDSQLASSEIGNMYTASIFMALMSCLEMKLSKKEDLENQRIGFCAYGSGSKSKVFEGILQKDAKEIIEKFGIFSTLKLRQAVDLDTYEKLHDKKQAIPVSKQKEKFVLSEIKQEPETLAKARFYAYLK